MLKPLTNTFIHTHTNTRAVFMLIKKRIRIYKEGEIKRLDEHTFIPLWFSSRLLSNKNYHVVSCLVVGVVVVTSTPSYIQERELRSYSTPSMSQIHLSRREEKHFQSTLKFSAAGIRRVNNRACLASCLQLSRARRHAQIHSGLPWWATLGATACIIRISMLPVVSKQMKASVLIAHATSVMQGKKSVRGRRFAEGTTNNDVPEKTSISADISETLRIAHAIRKRLPDNSTAPHPYWLIAAPLIQLPTFVCAISGVRTLIGKASNSVASGHQSALYADLSNGGILWFKDLTLSGLDLTNLYAPLGMYGVILPSLTAAMVFANIDLNFSKMASANPRGIQASIKLLLEWMCVPILVVGMQLPQAVHCYWLAGSTYSYLQSSAIRSEFGKKSKILGTAELERELKKLSQRGVDSAIALDSSINLSSARDLDSPSPELSTEMKDALIVAAELKASGRSNEACKQIEKLLVHNNSSRIDTSQGHPSLWYALQTRASMKNWKHAAAAYEACVRLEPDALKRGKALLGAGISRGKLNDASKAIFALQEAHNLLPKEASIMIALASAYKLNGDFDMALEVLKSAAEENLKFTERL